MRSIVDDKISTPLYPLRPNRYNTYGWNSHYQSCYDESDLSLLQKIETEHANLSETNKAESYFGLVIEKKIYEMWTCIKPYLGLQLATKSFTLPTQEPKNSQIYPLWHYADNMAREIANWQSERTKNQNSDLMNDPVMLAFEELKKWYFSILSTKECTPQAMDDISKRQSYIKNLIHNIPHFGPDRLHLHELHQSLEKAEKIILSCISNKDLPQFLVDTIITSKGLENTIGTYLHFLLINEEVTDNFSPDYINGSSRNCHQSPICKLYNEVSKTSSVAIRNTAEFNKFYHLVKIDEEVDTLQVQLNLKSELSAKIKFASFMTENDKHNYIEAVASLEALTNVRRILEHFQNILPRIGTYVFALHYLEKVDILADNFIKLISKTKLLLKDLLHTADHGLNIMLSNPDTIYIKNNYFEKNLRALETKVAKGTTVNAQLEKYCNHATESMIKYQQAMKKLVHSVNSGDAAQELEMAMNELFTKMNNQNIFLPSILNSLPILIKNPNKELIPAITPDTLKSTTELPKLPPANSVVSRDMKSLGFFSLPQSTVQSEMHLLQNIADTSLPQPLEITPDNINVGNPTNNILSNTNQNATFALGFVLGSLVLHYARKHPFFSRRKSQPLSSSEKEDLHRTPTKK